MNKNANSADVRRLTRATRKAQNGPNILFAHMQLLKLIQTLEERRH